ncbi:hypothetical protein [Streptomyces clavuligerus]|nr:hypothetical protein [Streptomyces clavuligerus]WDN56688.1 histidine kinase [Streptomyces clavuligerus]
MKVLSQGSPGRDDLACRPAPPQEDRMDEDRTDDSAGPGLEALADLVSAGGVDVAREGDDDLSGVPGPVSREAYRIIREGLANARRHCGATPVVLAIRLRDGWRDDRRTGWWRRIACPGRTVGPGLRVLEIRMDNLVFRSHQGVRPGPYRGLREIRDRAALLGGRADAGMVPTGPGEAVWRLLVRLPVEDRAGR